MVKFVTGVAVVDVEKRLAPSKHYAYVVNVAWSDGMTVTIYRRYSTFYELHIRMMDEFPVESGIDGGERSIPYLPGKKLFGRSHTYAVALSRTKLLEEYLKALIEMPSKISRSTTVLDFFAANALDSKPVPVAERLQAAKEARSKCVVAADYKKAGEGQLSLTCGNVVDIVEKNENGWWLVAFKGEEGWVPSTFLRTVAPPPPRARGSASATEREERQSSFANVANKTQAVAPSGARPPRPPPAGSTAGAAATVSAPRAAMRSAPSEKISLAGRAGRAIVGEEFYVVEAIIKTDDTGLSLAKGTRVTLQETSDSGWWYVSTGVAQGWVPAEFLEKGRPSAGGSGGGGSAVHTRVTTIVTNPLMEESSFEIGNSLPVGGAVAAAKVSKKMKGRAAYAGSSPGEASIKEGEVVGLLETGEGGWVFVRKSDGQEGWVPSDFLDDAK